MKVRNGLVTPDKRLYFGIIDLKCISTSTYVVVNQRNQLTEMVLLSYYSVRFIGEIRK